MVATLKQEGRSALHALAQNALSISQTLTFDEPFKIGPARFELRKLGYAIEVATGEVDGLTSFFGVNNFYLYQLEGTRRFVFLPWDHDFNFTFADHSIYFGSERNRLIERLLGDPELREFYRSTLHAIVTQYVNPAWMTPRAEAMVALIRGSVLEDTKRRPGDFDAAVAHIESFIAARGGSVSAQLQARRRRAARH